MINFIRKIHSWDIITNKEDSPYDTFAPVLWFQKKENVKSYFKKLSSIDYSDVKEEEIADFGFALSNDKNENGYWLIFTVNIKEDAPEELKMAVRMGALNTTHVLARVMTKSVHALIKATETE